VGKGTGEEGYASAVADKGGCTKVSLFLIWPWKATYIDSLVTLRSLWHRRPKPLQTWPKRLESDQASLRVMGGTRPRSSSRFSTDLPTGRMANTWLFLGEFQTCQYTMQTKIQVALRLLPSERASLRRLLALHKPLGRILVALHLRVSGSLAKARLLVSRAVLPAEDTAKCSLWMR
jgi:hypothetical protein